MNRPVTGLALLLSVSALAPAVARGANRTATLEWTAPGDDGFIGTARTYEIRFSRNPINPQNFLLATRLNVAKLPGPAGIQEHLTVLGLTPGVGYYFAMCTMDEAGNRSNVSNIAFLHSNVAGVEDAAGGIVEFAAPYPNPAMNSTRFSISMPQPDWVRVEAFDVEGRKVRTLMMGQYSAGHFDLRWDLRDDTGHTLRTGIYMVRSQIGDNVFLRRVTVVS